MRNIIHFIPICNSALFQSRNSALFQSRISALYSSFENHSALFQFSQYGLIPFGFIHLSRKSLENTQ